MSTTATYDDVNLILRLYEMRREEKLRAARAWFVANFKPKSADDIATLAPAGTEQNAYYRMVITYWEMAASFITAGVLNQELFFQSNQELLLVYTRVKNVLPELRRKFTSPAMWQNLETVALEYIKYYEKKDPDSYKAFIARVG